MKNVLCKMRNILGLVLCLLLIMQFVLPASTSALGLKLSPLLYNETLEKGEKKKGFIDVSNPNDTPVTVVGEVQGFRQTNNNGDLEFFEKPEYQRGIQLDYTEFTLGPREALRLYFLLDANLLPAGGVYGAILLRTVPQGANPDNTSIQPSTRVGTLLVVNNGGGGTKSADIEQIKAPFVQIGKAIQATVVVKNVGGDEGLAFFPELSARAQPFRSTTTQQASLVFPGITRENHLEVPGNYFGIVRLKVGTEGSVKHKWLFVATGYGRLVGLLILIAACTTAGGFAYIRRRSLRKKK